MTTKKKPTSSDAKSKAFTRGFALAISEMSRGGYSSSLIDTVLHDAGYYSIGEFVAAGVDPSDVKQIKKHIPRATKAAR